MEFAFLSKKEWVVPIIFLTHTVIIGLVWDIQGLSILSPLVITVTSIAKTIYLNLFSRNWLYRHLTYHHWPIEKCLIHLTGIIVLIVISYGLDYWSLHQTQLNAFHGIFDHAAVNLHFFNFLYFSAVTFSTVGFGDIAPATIEAKIIVMTEIVSSFFMIIFIFSNFYNLKTDRTRFSGSNR